MYGVQRKRQWRRSRLVTVLAMVALTLTMIPMLPTSNASAADVNVSLSKYLCPEGFDAASADFAGLQDSCVAIGAGFPFSVLPEGGEGIDQNTDGGGVAIWTGLPAGSGIVAETAAENNTSRVFCGIYPTGGSLPGSYSEFNATGNVIGYSLEDGESLDCLWYNVPLPIDESSVVNVQKLACSAEFEVESAAELAPFLAECTESLAGIDFTLLPSEGIERLATTDGGGFAGWADVPAGPLTIVEAVPSGFEVAAVFCATAPLTGGGDGTYDPMSIADGSAVSSDLGVASYLECFWFNQPVGSESEINAFKYACPEGYDWTGLSIEALSQNCDLPVADVEFELSGAAAFVQSLTNSSGQVSFPGGLGEFSLTEGIPAAFSDVRSFCSTFPAGGAPGLYEEYAVDAGRIDFSLDANESITCVWYNLPVTVDPAPASLTINVYTCQSLHDPIEPVQTLQAECNEPTEDILFTLGRDGSVASASTGEGGRPSTIQFSELEPGSYLLTEEIPETIRLAYINECRSDARAMQYPFAPFAIIESDGRIGVELLPGENLECDWYNIQQDTPGTVTIVKYWCDGTSDALTNCELYTDGVGFTMNRLDGGEQLLLETGPDGLATTDALGTYELIEDDYEWCSAQSTAVDANGNVVVESGQNVTIEIYNCGPRPLAGG